MTRLPYAQMIEVKRWADRGLCQVVERDLSKLGETEAGLMLLVLDHIHTVDRIFQAHLLGRPHGYKAARSEVLPPFEVLARDMAEVDDWYADHVGALAPEAFEQPIDFVFTSGKPARMKRGEIILHVCLHGTYHRGNAGALLQLKGLVPSRDAVSDYLEAMEEAVA